MELEGNLDDDQEGFTVGRSTTRYLFRMIANLNCMKKKKLACIILFIDFQKAFDSVRLPTLMTKLNRLGVQGRILKLLHPFLFNRKVKLKVNDFIGAPILCSLFGLPQGSVLSRLLFILYVADMTDEMPKWLKKWLSCYKFADDGTLLIAHHNMFKCYRLMQRLCSKLSKWCQKNKLVINCELNKTKAIIQKTGGEPCPDKEQPPELQINGLLAQRKTFRRRSARIFADSARFRADPANFRQKYFLADSAERLVNVRQTPAESVRIRADPRGLRGELAEEFTGKMSADKNLPYTTVPRGKTSAADVLPPRK